MRRARSRSRTSGDACGSGGLSTAPRAAWLAIPTFGEAWHNSHHAFPTSAVHGMKKRQIDPSAGVIWSLEKLGLARDVVRIAPERQAAKAAA